MNLFTKTAPWMMASLLAAVSAFGQTTCPPSQMGQKPVTNQGEELGPNQLMAAYNAPARPDVRGAWDAFATGTYTYWQAMQENMEYAIINNTTGPALGTVNQIANAENGTVANMDFDYKSGFKVGLGFNFDHDNWDLYGQYTWFRGRNDQTTTLNSQTPAVYIQPMLGDVANRLLFPVYAGLNSSGQPTGTNMIGWYTAKEDWKLHMDIADLELSRCYYNGRSLTFRPFFGVRGAWIRQNRISTYTGTDNVSTSTASSTSNARALATATTNLNVKVTEKSHSWAVGPRAGFYSNWLMDYGLRLFGNGSGDILYTRYSDEGSEILSTQTTISSGNRALTKEHLDTNHFGYLRTHLDLELGLGWGSYFDNNNWHVDLSAGYEFQVFFDQNMFRHFEGNLLNLIAATTDYQNTNRAANGVALSSLPHGNLYVQGLNATVRFDF